MIRPPSYRFVQEINGIDLQDTLFQSIKQKKRALALYNNLMAEPLDAFAASLLATSRVAEEKMLDRLNNRYQQLFGPVPDYEADPLDVTFYTYIDGILLSIDYNTQAIIFEQEVLDRLDANSVDFQLYIYVFTVK